MTLYTYEEAKQMLIQAKKKFMEIYKDQETCVIFDIENACAVGKLPENFNPEEVNKFEVYLYFDHYVETSGRGYSPNERFISLELGMEISI